MGRLGLRSVAWHAEDEARAVLGEVWLGLVEPRLHRHGALLPVKAALHRVGDVDLKVALLTGGHKERGWQLVRKEPQCSLLSSMLLTGLQVLGSTLVHGCPRTGYALGRPKRMPLRDAFSSRWKRSEGPKLWGWLPYAEGPR